MWRRARRGGNPGLPPLRHPGPQALASLRIRGRQGLDELAQHRPRIADEGKTAWKVAPRSRGIDVDLDHRGTLPRRALVAVGIGGIGPRADQQHRVRPGQVRVGIVARAVGPHHAQAPRAGFRDAPLALDRGRHGDACLLGDLL